MGMVSRFPSELNMGVGQQLSPSVINSVRVTAVAERLASHALHPGSKSSILEFFHLCLSLARGIDYALAQNEIPAKARELPKLLKQVCQRRHDILLEAAIMVLMISVKNACKIGWFSDMESQELLTLADEIGSGFSRLGDINAGPSNLVSTISTIMIK
ncbi:hypothetical protein Pint_15085 [Pistacia integerrima]|uniref:Uncharacterized protein n=1 Tax=Pistacia integerrima TaxID=434235 RepID=A0ACC0ZDQ4_9ROSI|nr:hypothetical protein Pint_15085 [Pistacia integerrima]